MEEFGGHRVAKSVTLGLDVEDFQKEGSSSPANDFRGFFSAMLSICQDCIVVVQVSDPIKFWDVPIEPLCSRIMLDHEVFDGIPYLWYLVEFAVCLPIFSAGFFFGIRPADFFSGLFAKVLL